MTYGVVLGLGTRMIYLIHSFFKQIVKLYFSEYLIYTSNPYTFRVRVMILSATFNYISVISWR